LSDDFTLKFEGLTQMQTKLEEVRTKYPFKEEEILQKLGKKLKASSKDKTPLGKHKKHLKDKYKLSKVIYGKDGTNITLINTSPHFHLIEAGHNIVKGKGGPVIGFVPGKHMVENSMVEMEGTLPIVVNAWLDDVLGKIK